jgi:hypothetical protein
MGMARAWTRKRVKSELLVIPATRPPCPLPLSLPHSTTPTQCSSLSQPLDAVVCHTRAFVFFLTTPSSEHRPQLQFLHHQGFPKQIKGAFCTSSTTKCTAKIQSFPLRHPPPRAPAPAAPTSCLLHILRNQRNLSAPARPFSPSLLKHNRRSRLHHAQTAINCLLHSYRFRARRRPLSAIRLQSCRNRIRNHSGRLLTT